jgi:hypothetical protein
MKLEGLGKLKESSSSGTRTSNLPASRISASTIYTTAFPLKKEYKHLIRAKELFYIMPNQIY